MKGAGEMTTLKRPQPKNTNTKKSKSTYPAPDRMLTMQEAMKYLSDKGFPCRSRSTFYRVLEEFDIQFMDLNPSGKHAIRRFPLSGLQKFLELQGLEP
jgi:hypothetical protein